MTTRHTFPRPADAPRPLSPREIERRLDDLLDAVAHLAGSRGGWLPPADLVRCLDPLVSRN